LIEVKSEHMMKDEQTNAKFWAANDYAVEQGWDFEVWTKEELNIMKEQTNGL